MPEWRTCGRGGGAHPLRHHRVGVKPYACESLLERILYRFRDEAATPGLWQPMDWWAAAQNREMWNDIVIIATR